ncbi:MAG: amidohydrolase family protein [Candidatus Eremiobacteraeota bacterium]|nr:amidohydrolase family protein [Candidatus Eremiobacteraeota bacterium]MBV8654746.1 amidohydrolase family protein [Candidatus Eremiobacteraeota bacterium]
MSVSELVRCKRAIAGGEYREDFAFVVRDGTIVAAGDFQEVREQARDLDARSFPADRLVVPGFVNGHSHAYQILLRGWSDDLPFAKWRSDALYKVVPQLRPDDVYWTFVAAFSEMLAAGITTVAEFFYLNGNGNAHAEAAIRAAAETGIRLVFARTWMDAGYAPPEFRETIGVAAERTRELIERYPQANVCVAPHSLHAASHDMIRAAAEFAREVDCMMHVHVAEASYEGEQTVRAHGVTPIALLQRLGALDERTVAIHAIHITAGEKEAIANAGARVIHNPMTNQYLGDGICDVEGLQALGVTMGLGTDADVKPSLIDEMRSAALLQKIARLDGSALGARTAFALGTSQGAKALRIAAGDLAPGNAADYAVLDASRIDPWSPAVNALVYRGEDRWVQGTFVGGRRVYVGERSQLARLGWEAAEKIAKRLV